MIRKYLQTLILLGAVCAVALTSFVCLNELREFPPGWTSPTRIQERGGSISLIAHNGELLLAFNTRGDEGPDIAVISSKDGRKWSNPLHVVTTSAEDRFTPSNPQWLKRPDGDIWLLWYLGKDTGDNVVYVIYYAILKEDGTFGTPQMIHSLDYDYSFSAITNTGNGGLAMIEMYSPPAVSTFQGNRVIGRVFTHCVVQRADENLEWSPPITLSQTKFARCVDITVDGQGTIWAVYGESSPLEGTYVRTSEDCSIWSEPIMISTEFVDAFFQRHNGQSVLFFVKNDTSVYAAFSSDGVEWSHPTLIATVDVAYTLDVTESDDGTLWVVIESRNDFYVMSYNDEQYLESIDTLRDLYIENGVIATGIAVLFGFAVLFLKRRDQPIE